jgi:hypothetical protein
VSKERRQRRLVRKNRSVHFFAQLRTQAHEGPIASQRRNASQREGSGRLPFGAPKRGTRSATGARSPDVRSSTPTHPFHPVRLRPIACDVFRRMAAKLLCARAGEDAAAFLANFGQLGVACESGMDGITHAARRYAAEFLHPGSGRCILKGNVQSKRLPARSA